MQLPDLYQKASAFEFLSLEEGVFLYHHAPLSELMLVADELRKKQVPHGKVTWQIDRNVNTTNVCIANCKFCNFYRIPGHPEAYITDMPTYRRKIEETLKWGGDQLLLQGGHHPDLGLQFYVDTFKQIKKEFPSIKLHTLGPPEIAHITKLSKESGGEKSTYREVLIALKEAGFFNTDSFRINGTDITPLEFTSRLLVSEWKLGPEEEEFTVMKVIIKGARNGKPLTVQYDLLDRYDNASKLSSMSRTTGYTCTAAVNLILKNMFLEKGVFPPELVGKDKKCFDFVLEYLARRKVNWKVSNN